MVQSALGWNIMHSRRMKRQSIGHTSADPSNTGPRLIAQHPAFNRIEDRGGAFSFHLIKSAPVVETETIILLGQRRMMDIKALGIGPTIDLIAQDQAPAEFQKLESLGRLVKAEKNRTGIGSKAPKKLGARSAQVSGGVG